MPLVDGKRIDRWCDSNSLDARAIVRLYLQVCDAAAYAHRNLVIHRDIKPSNVLVDDNGHVHLLDFGIGQFTDAQDERTHTMWRALTPRSEEHTSELQSLMRISYAVFCLKKQNKHKPKITTHKKENQN